MKRYLAAITASLGLAAASEAIACLPDEPWSEDRHRTYQATLWANAETVYILRIDDKTWGPTPSNEYGPSVSPVQASVTPILRLKGLDDLPAPFVIREGGGGCVGGPFSRSRLGTLFVVYVGSAEAVAEGRTRGGTVSAEDLRDLSTLAAWESARAAILP